MREARAFCALLETCLVVLHWHLDHQTILSFHFTVPYLSSVYIYICLYLSIYIAPSLSRFYSFRCLGLSFARHPAFRNGMPLTPCISSKQQASARLPTTFSSLFAHSLVPAYFHPTSDSTLSVFHLFIQRIIHTSFTNVTTSMLLFLLTRTIYSTGSRGHNQQYQ